MLLFTPSWLTGPRTVSDAAEHWLESCARRHAAGRGIGRLTLRNYSHLTNSYVMNPEFALGSTPLRRLKRSHVVQHRDRLLDFGKSEQTIQTVLSLIRCILQQAVDHGYLKKNPALRIRVNGRLRTRGRFECPKPEEVRKLVQAAGDPCRAMILSTAVTGLRISELFALQWKDLDLYPCLVHVRRRADRWGQIGNPKSKAGMRTVPFGPILRDELLAWRKRCPDSSLDLVFPSSAGTVLDQSNFYVKHFGPLRQSLGLVHIRWHDLRHFAISAWLQQGVPPHVVQLYAGHAMLRTAHSDESGH